MLAPDTREGLLTFGNQSNGGTACTCVVTEYRYHDRPNFAIDVVLFTEAELKEQLRKMVDACRHNHFHSATMESENERKHWADQAKLAKDTFKAMFADQCKPEFLLSNNTDEHVIVDELLSRAMRLRSRHNFDGRVVSNSLEECSDLLMSLTSVSADAQGPEAWPFIKKIRYVGRSFPSKRTRTQGPDSHGRSVFLDAYILSKGLVLVDLPGMIVPSAELCFIPVVFFMTDTLN